MFDSDHTDYKITNTPFGRDLVKEHVEAFRAEGIKVGFYYSLIDWHHPEFTIDCNHPMRDQVTELLTNYGKIDVLWFDFSYGNDGYRQWMQGKAFEGL